MSESNSDSTNSAESFELINNDQKFEKILISPSLSSTSTENIEDLGNIDNEEFRMEQEFKDKLDISNISNIIENQLIKNNDSISDQSSQQSISNISNDNLNEFNNEKLQQQLNMQIQSNNQQLTQAQQIDLTKQPQILQQQLNVQQLNELNQKLQLQEKQQQQFNQQQQLKEQQQINQLQQQQLNPQINSQINSQISQQQFNPKQQFNQVKLEQNQSQSEETNKSSSNKTELAKIASPISSFDPSSFLSSSFGWLSKKDIINRVTENAVNLTNTVLVTLDPGLKEMLPGGPNILITSNQIICISSIRDGFLDVFKRATVKSVEIVNSIETAAQLVGFETAVKINLERIKALRSNISIVAQNQVIVSIENFLFNFNDRWFDSDCFLLDDPLNNIQLSVHSQATPIDNKYIEQLKTKSTSYKYKEDGFNLRLDNLIASDLNCSIGEWHNELVGFDKSQLHHQAVVLLSNLYKNKLKEIGRLNE